VVIPEEGGPLNPPHHDVVQSPGGIEAGLPGHGVRESSISRQRMQRPRLRVRVGVLCFGEGCRFAPQKVSLRKTGSGGR
jgi:hypothetical protein